MKTELTNMVMVRDPGTGMVAVINRRRSWRGLSFPGGHVEPGESFVRSAVREVREETGLEVRNLRSVGVVDWVRSDTGDRYLVFCYRTEDFSGELRTGDPEEGEVFWIRPEEIASYPSENDFVRYLKLFLAPEGETFNEVYLPWQPDREPDASAEQTYL